MRLLFVPLLSLLLGCPDDGPTDTAFDVTDDIDVAVELEVDGDVPDVVDRPPDTDEPAETNAPDDSDPPDPILAEVVDLGDVALVDGASGDLTVEIPADVTSFVISAVGAPAVFYAVDHLVSPSGVAIVTKGWPDSNVNQGGTTICLICDNRVVSAEAAHGALVPNTPKVGFETGTWTFTVTGFTVTTGGPFAPPKVEPADGVVAVSMALQRRPAERSGVGVLDLNLFFTGAHDLTAATAPNDARLQKAVQYVKGTYAQVGVVLGDVRYFDLEGAPQAVESINGEDNDFEALASLTADAPPGVNLIFVREIVDTKNPLGGLGIILGVAGGIPGPAGLQGSGRSAVIVSLDEPPDQPGAPEVELGHTMAHEAGHYLGLFHSSELFGQAHDPLDDTKLNDQDNLMYFSSAGSTLSPDQGFVIRNNPWVRPEFVP